VLDGEPGLRPPAPADPLLQVGDHGGADAQALQQRVHGQLPQQTGLRHRAKIGAAGGDQSPVAQRTDHVLRLLAHHQREHLGDRRQVLRPTGPGQIAQIGRLQVAKRHLDVHPSILAEGAHGSA